jgi:monoamine oxidase
MRAIQEIARSHHDAQRLGITPEEARHSRREFLKRSGAIGGALMIGAPGALARSARATTVPRIAIVGGGIAGLTAALTLSDAGLPCTLYEAHPTRLGGRMHSDSPLVSGGDDYFQGQVAEWCGELIDTSHKTILQLSQRFGLNAVDLLAAEPNSSTETYFFQNGYYSFAQASDDFQPVHHTIQSQKQAAGSTTTYNNFNAAGQQLDNTSLFDWIEQFVPGGHGSRFGALLDVAYNEEFGAETNLQSSLNLIYLLAFQPEPGNFRIFGISDERYHIAGGNQQLPEAIASHVSSGGRVSIRPGSRMNTVALNRDGTASLVFDGSSTPVVYDQVILCMSFSVLRTLDFSKAGFSPLKQTAINQLGSGRNAKLQLQFDNRLWNTNGPWGLSNGDVYADLGFQNAWDVTRAQAGTQGIMNNYTGGNVAGALAQSTPYSNASNNPKVKPIAKAFLGKLETVFPGITAHWNGRAILSTPFLDPNLLCSYAYWKTGQYTTFAGEVDRALRDPLEAGEHCSVNFQGFMEGGAQEGIRAAKEIVALVK